MKKIILLLTTAILISCQSQTEAKAILSIEGNALEVELADTPELRQKGLMNRKSLDEESGMLFIFDEERRVSFWMKNTSLPLSIAFIGKDGIIKQISPLEPYSQKSVKSDRSVKYALEVNRTYFEKKNIKAGDLINFPDDWPYK